MFIDTHCHIHDRETYDFALSRQQISQKSLAKNPEIPHEASDFAPEKILERARENGVEKMIVIGTSHADSLAARAFAEAHANVFWSYGIHPDEAADGKEGLFVLGGMRSAAARAAAPAARGDGPAGRVAKDNNSSFPLVAIGEVGLDYRNGLKTRTAEITLLEQMLELAQKLDLPLIFHVRDAFDDFWPIVDNAKVKRAVIHSFSDSEENLKKALGRDFYIGVNGLATFANLPTPPLEKTLLETDAPFLAPVPVRGRVNEPSYIPDIAAFLAEKHQTTIEEVAKITTKNAKKLFKL